MIQLSPSAVKEIQRLLSKQNKPNIFFRLQVQPGGCSGLLYDIGFDEAIASDDCVFNSTGISVVVDATSCDYVKDLRLDFSEDLMGGGFRFHNPQAIASCGCGNSFSVSEN